MIGFKNPIGQKKKMQFWKALSVSWYLLENLSEKVNWNSRENQSRMGRKFPWIGCVDHLSIYYSFSACIDPTVKCLFRILFCSASSIRLLYFVQLAKPRVAHFRPPFQPHLIVKVSPRQAHGFCCFIFVVLIKKNNYNRPPYSSVYK